ncbi:MAG: PqqD family protein [Candidatus Omnitrophota bacterium]
MPLARKYRIDKDKVTYRVIDNEAVILNLDSGYYYSLNGVGTEIWKMMAVGKTTDEILDYFEAEYRLSKSRLKGDLLELINDLEREGLIQAL